MDTFPFNELGDAMTVLAGWCCAWVIHFVRQQCVNVARHAVGEDETISFE